MANFIRVPLKDTQRNTTYMSGPRYGLINVTNAYDVAASGSDEHIRIYTTLPSTTTAEVQTYIIEYFSGHGAVVTDQDILNLRNLIISANQNPGSNPIFELLVNDLNGGTNIEEDYQADDFVYGSNTPI
jgi:hypothetical protein